MLDEKADGLRYQFVSGEKTSVEARPLAVPFPTIISPRPVRALSPTARRSVRTRRRRCLWTMLRGYERLAPDCRRGLRTSRLSTAPLLPGLVRPRGARTCRRTREAPSHAIRRSGTIPKPADPFVYLTELHAFRLDGLQPDESNALADRVFGTLYDPATIHRHSWADGRPGHLEQPHGPACAGPRPKYDERILSARSIRRVSTGSITSPSSSSSRLRRSPKIGTSTNGA